MLLNTNQTELLQLAKHFYNITKTLIAIYDSRFNMICAYPNYMCEFCTLVRKNDELDRRCFCDDFKAFEICKATRKTYIYKCHMGLVEVATPIIYNNIIVGYMQFGQITDQKDRSNIYNQIDLVADNFGFDKETLINTSKKISYHTKEYIESICIMLEMCANYIWLNSIISVRNDSLAHSIDLHINQYLNGDLSVPMLCKQFGIGRSKLYEIAKNNFGSGIADYVQLCRLNKAKQLLSDCKLSVSEIADAVGFEDVNYFIRFFKKHIGITPKKYQNQAK